MCRWIAYRGETTALEHYVTEPAHSLDFPEHPRARGDRERQRRRFRARLVRHPSGAGALPRDQAGLVGREPALPVPAPAVAPVLRPCPRRDRHRDHPRQLPSVCLREVAVHAQRLRRQLEPAAPQGRGADSGPALSAAHRHHRHRSDLPRHHGRRHRASAGGDGKRAAKTHRLRQPDQAGRPSARHRGAVERAATSTRSAMR